MTGTQSAFLVPGFGVAQPCLLREAREGTSRQKTSVFQVRWIFTKTIVLTVILETLFIKKSGKG